MSSVGEAGHRAPWSLVSLAGRNLCTHTVAWDECLFIVVYRELSPSHFFPQTHSYIVKTSLDDDYWS